ncbi:MAG: type I polyketide synthase, partial [Leptolyngbyaceae cyanobacterium SL_7_1]|nr:type I polyketide synthase [Leptolyngbyaceae cyanobacterium SL_7_1]
CEFKPAWNPGDSEGLALAGVSAFGFGGTNAHVVMQAAPPAVQCQTPIAPERSWHGLILSAKTEPALQQLVARYQTWLAEQTATLSLADVCLTANTGRSDFAQRLGIVASSLSHLQAQLARVSQGKEGEGIVWGIAPRKAPAVVFLFTGQGCQYPDMGRELYETQAVFRAAIDRCDAILQALGERSLRASLYPIEPSPHDHPADHQPAPIQPAPIQLAIFAVEYALVELWRSWGVEPSAVLGHSLGEYVAAWVAGVFSLEDGLKLVAARGRLMQQSASGAMAAVVADAATVRAFLETDTHGVAIAALNSPHNTVISGSSQRSHLCVGSGRLRASKRLPSRSVKPSTPP